MKIQSKSKIWFILTYFAIIAIIIIAFFAIRKPFGPNKIKTSYLRGSFSIDYNNLNEVVGDADYVFLGTIANEEGTVYKYTSIIEREDGTTYEVSSPYTNYSVNVLENIKGHLVTDTAIPIQKAGGLSKDGTEYYIYEGDFLPTVGNSYIFFAYAQPDGSLLISGPVSNISIDNVTNNISSLAISTEYENVVNAYKNQIDSGRTRFTSSYETD